MNTYTYNRVNIYETADGRFLVDWQWAWNDKAIRHTFHSRKAAQIFINKVQA